MAEQLSGADLDARFFEVCWGYVRREYYVSCWAWYHIDDMAMNESICVGDDAVSTNANACEAWAMRWSRQANLRYEICEMQDHVLVVLVNFERDLFEARGADWKQAFVRACVAAGLELPKQSKGE